MAKKLDRNKPFGVVQGEHNAAFEQDGIAFDIDGNELVSEKPGGRAKKAADPEPVAAPAAVDEQLAAQGAE